MDKQKRKWFNHSSQSYKKSKQLSLEIGMTGFLCTCNFREKECIRDACKLLEEYSSEDSGLHEENNIKDNPIDESQIKEIDDKDISDVFNEELEELKKETKKPVKERKLKYIDTGAKNVIFIHTTLADPMGIVLKIVKDFDKTKKQRSRFLLRMIPVLTICKANLNDIELKASVLLEKYFSQESKTFSIVFNRHNNNSIQRMDVINILAAVITKINPENKVDLTQPEIAVVVEIIKGFCLLSVAPDYLKYKKYNLLELSSVKEVFGDPDGAPKVVEDPESSNAE